MKKQHNKYYIALSLLFACCCFFSNAQQTSAAKKSGKSYNEEYVAHATELYDWNQIEKEFIKRTHSNLQESEKFFRHIYRNNFVNMSDYLDKVDAGIITKSNATQYWLDQLPLFEKLYHQEIANMRAMEASVPASGGLPVSAFASCNNLDFTNRTANWNGRWNNSGANHYGDQPTGLPTIGMNTSAGTDAKNYVHEIMTGGQDPHVPISTIPPGHTRALRLGSDECYGLTTNNILPFNHQMIRNTFTVSAANPTITYWYAVVFTQDVGKTAHLPTEQPFFKIRMFDQGGNEIKCASYDVDVSKGVAGGFKTKNLTDIPIGVPDQMGVYKDWVNILIPLVDYVNQQITIQFESSDCKVGGHVGYAYVAVDCGPFDVITSTPYVCGSNTIQLTAPEGSNSYKWTGPGVIQPDNKQVVSVNKPGKYTVSMSVVGNNNVICTYDIDTVIASNPLDLIALYSNTTVCQGKPTVFKDESTTSGTLTGWEWDFNNDGITDSNLQNPSYTFPTAGTFDVKLTIKQGDCEKSITKKVTVDPLPVLKITNPPAVCLPTTVDITAASVTAGTTGTGILSYWTDALATQTLSSPNTIETSGTYYIKITSAAGCSDIKPVVVTINPGAVLKITNPPAVCIPGTVDITAAYVTAGSTGGGTLSYWMDAAATSPLTNPTSIGISSTYYIKSTPASGCTDIKPVVVTIVPLPILTITNPPAVCVPNTVDITAASVTAGSTTGGVLSYWKDAAATVLLTNPNAVTAAGTYYIKIKVGDCEVIKPVTTVIHTLPVSNAGPDVIVCTGEVASLGASGTPNYTYLWSPLTGLNNGTLSNPTSTIANTGSVPLSTIYVVTTTNTLTGCSSTDTMKVTVNPLVIVNAGTAASVCPGSKARLSGSIGGAATSAKWSGGSGRFDDENSLDTYYLPTETEFLTGTVTLTLTTNDPEGPCPSAASTVVLTFYKNPTVSYTVDKKNGCPVHCVKFSDSSYVEGTSDYIEKWNWNFGDSYGPPQENISSLPKPSHCYGTPGYYDVKLTVTSNHGCQSTHTIPQMIQVFNVPVAAFYPTPNPVSVLDPTVTLVNGSSSDVVEWNYHFGDGDSISPDVSSPIHKYPEVASQTYVATLNVKNKDGCVHRVEHQIEVGPEFTFYIPNAFTPDGDGINDYFSGKGIGIVKYDFVIFDRWGNLIFHSENLEDQWNGKVNNGEEISQQDVFVWKVKLTDIFGKKHDFMGTVTLIK